MTELVKKKTLAECGFDLEKVCEEVDASESLEIPEALMIRFAGAKLALSEKVDAWISYLDAIKQMVATLKERKERAAKAYKVAGNLEKRLKSYVKSIMEVTPQIAFTGSDGALYLHKNPKALKVKYDHEGDIERWDAKTLSIKSATVDHVVPEALLSLEPSMMPYIREVTLKVMDRAKLKKDIEAGMQFPWASIHQDSHVRTKG